MRVGRILSLLKLFTFSLTQGRNQRVGMNCSSNYNIDMSIIDNGTYYCGGVLVKDVYCNFPLKILFRRIMCSSKLVEQGLAIDEGSPIWTRLCIVAKSTHVALCNFPPGWESRSDPLLYWYIIYLNVVETPRL
jgi:hypothetical protein